MKSLRLLLALGLIVGAFSLVACGDDDDDNPTNPGGTTTDPWVGEWYMEGDNVPSILTDFLNIKNVRVTFRENLTVTTVETDSTDAVTTRQGSYTVTESATGNIHSITTSYNDGLNQAGIVEIVDGSPDVLKLEVVPVGGTIPVPTPATGFGTTAPNESNVQRYERQ